jgi:hypothetical protein
MNVYRSSFPCSFRFFWHLFSSCFAPLSHGHYDQNKKKKSAQKLKKLNLKDISG